MDKEVTPEDQHNVWLESKLAAGWTFGKEESLEDKKTPNLIPYCDVPTIQKGKDALFLAIVKSMKDIVTEDAIVPAVIQVGKLPVKYIGLRAQYTDGLYGTGIKWEKGETQMVPEEAAFKLLKHVDQYEMGEMVADVAPEDELDPVEEEDLENTDEAIQMAKDAVNQMRSKKAVVDWVEVTFQGMKLDINEKLAPLKEKAVGFIDQYRII